MDAKTYGNQFKAAMTELLVNATDSPFTLACARSAAESEWDGVDEITRNRMMQMYSDPVECATDAVALGDWLGTQSEGDAD